MFVNRSFFGQYANHKTTYRLNPRKQVGQLVHALYSLAQDIVQCPISYVVVPAVDVNSQRKMVAQKLKGVKLAKGKAKPAIVRKLQKPKKQGSAPPVITYKRWPVMTPINMLKAVIQANAGHLLTLGQPRSATPHRLRTGVGFNWLHFWRAESAGRTVGEDTCLNSGSGCVSNVCNCVVSLRARSHPVQQWPDERKARTVAVAWHGDEGQGKRNRSALVMSWSSLGVHRKSTHCWFPFAATRLHT